MKYKAEEWYQIDLLIDWTDQQIIIRSHPAKNATDTYTSRQPFFTKRKQRIVSANGISIYGLTPQSVSRFKNIRVCTEFCPDCKFVNPHIDGLNSARFYYLADVKNGGFVTNL